MSKSAPICQLITQAQPGTLCELLCLILAVVLADDSRQGAEDGQMEVSPVPGTALTWAGGHLLGVLYTNVSTEKRMTRVRTGGDYWSTSSHLSLMGQTPQALAMACASPKQAPQSSYGMAPISGPSR